jgi:O-antigen ligase
MVLTLPFAIHLARFAPTRLGRQASTVGALLITAAVPVTLSRTGVLALFVMALALLPAWPWRVRFNIGAATAGLLAATVVAVPGLLGTLVSLFSNLSGDPSIEGRTQDYAQVYRFVAQRPWLGRGPGTFVPKLYIVLDNQWLGTLVDSGAIGVVALAAMHLTAIWLAAVTLRRSSSARDRHLCACLIAVQLVAVAVGGTFDSLGFTTFATTVAVLMGLSAAMWRLSHPTRQVRTTAPAGV